MGEIKDRLKQIRLASKKTQKSMSFDLGLSENTWQTYERGLSFPKFDTLQKLAGAGFSMDWLITGTGEMRVSAGPSGGLMESGSGVRGAGRILEEEGLDSFLGPPREGTLDGFSIDPFLFGRCLDAICKLFQDLKIKAPPTILGEEAAMIYQDIAASGVYSLEEQLIAIQMCIRDRSSG